MSKTTWNIDTAHSGIHFSVRHMVFAKVRGRFAAWQGKIDIDPADLTRSSVEVTIDAASIDTGVVDRDNHLRSADFFDVAKFPTLAFKSRKVDAAGDDKLLITGDLTIRDVTREVVLKVESSGEGKDPWGNRRLVFSASTSVDRRDFGLTWNQALELGGVLVGEKVEIELELQAVGAAASVAA